MAVALAWAAPGAAKEAPTAKLITFSVRLSPDDPFSDANQVGATLKEVRRGESIRLTITATPKKGYHTYPLTRRTAKQSKGQLTALKYDKSDTFRPLWPAEETEAEFVDEGPEIGVLLDHERRFTYSQDILVLPTAKPGPAELRFTIDLQVCKTSCVRGEHVFSLPVKVLSEPAVSPDPEVEKRLAAAEPEPEVVAPAFGTVVKKREEEPAPAKSAGPAVKMSDATGGASDPAATRRAAARSGKEADLSLLGRILKMFGGGLLSLLTPCVFPMIPITVSFFLKQSEARPQRAVLLAGVYSLTIVLVLAAGGLLLVKVLQQISRHWATNFGLATMFFVFSLSLFGMFDLTLPRWLSDATSAREGQGGVLGTFFMALTFTIISFTCVGPIYGGFIATEATASGGGWLHNVPSVLAFSVAFALPFFLLALFPGLLRTLPRSGAWMNAVKVVMAFLELAAVFKFVRAGELNLFGKADWFTFDVVLGIWIALCVACSLYLLSLYRLPHDHDAPDSIGVVRLQFSLTFLALAVYLTPGLFKNDAGVSQKPRGELFFQIESFLLPDTPASQPWRGSAPGSGDSSRPRGLVWHSRLDEALARAKADRRLVFIDFTGID
jgi:thiol:disulfide interchange protein DsbD